MGLELGQPNQHVQSPTYQNLYPIKKIYPIIYYTWYSNHEYLIVYQIFLTVHYTLGKGSAFTYIDMPNEPDVQSGWINRASYAKQAKSIMINDSFHINVYVIIKNISSTVD